MNTTKKTKIIVRNPHKVPARLWKGFGPTGKMVFNQMMEKTLTNQKNITHPKTATLPPAQWQTICWNMACFAAWNKAGEDIMNINILEQSTKK